MMKVKKNIVRISRVTLIFLVPLIFLYTETDSRKATIFALATFIVINFLFTNFLIKETTSEYIEKILSKINILKLNSNISFLAYLLIITVLVFISQNVNLNYETVDWDIHSYLVASQEISNGYIPFETQWESKGPLLFYIYNFISVITVKNYLFFKLFNDIILLMIVLILSELVKEKTDSRYKGYFASTFFVLLMSKNFGNSEYSELYSLLFLSISYLLYLKNKDEKYTPFFVALLVSLSTLVNQGTVIFVIPYLMNLFLKKTRTFKLSQDIKISFIGFVFPHLFFIGLYLVNNLLDIYYATFVSIPLGYTSESFNILNELIVFLRSYFQFSSTLYFVVISLGTLLFLEKFNTIITKTGKKSDNFLNNLFLFTSILFYILGSHGFEHHLIFLVFFASIVISQFERLSTNIFVGLVLIISMTSIFQSSFESSYQNLKNYEETYSNYPLLKLASEIESRFDSEYTILALDYVLLLYYLDKPNFSYIVHPTNHYADFITKELIELNRIKENNIDELICYQREDCKEPDVIICSHRMIINGEVIKNKLFNCMVSDYKKNYYSIDTKSYTYDENLSYYFDPYKEIAVFIKDKDI
ncbi:hypothetical protein OAP09_01525 [Acidimicrobiia bacterium]|nr:hypothetical protein [Acidimicrobiia bacterium]